MDKLEGLLFRFGIYRCQEGYDCILAAMELVEEDETLLKRLIGGLYPAAAARGGTLRQYPDQRRAQHPYVHCKSMGCKPWVFLKDCPQEHYTATHGGRFSVYAA